MSVLIETSIGSFTVDLFVEKRPKCSFNFLKLCKIKYYNWCLFHNVEKNFIAQTGDPSDSGESGHSIYLKDPSKRSSTFPKEIYPKMKHKISGILSMVNNGNDQHGSQFLITLAPMLNNLDRSSSIFGQIVDGFEIIDYFNNKVACNESNRPFKDIRITHTIIIDDPFPDPEWLILPERSPSPPVHCFNTDFIAINEQSDGDDDNNNPIKKSKEELKRELEEQELRKNAKILEIVGDLPHADIKPDDNVLFVCKLNAITMEDDLELIFSRFGPIRSCEIIRDKTTGNSLQYGFIEFERKEDCESAVIKMENVLIDDRRIHVDFSQSVSKKMNYKIVKKSKKSSEKQKRKEWNR